MVMCSTRGDRQGPQAGQRADYTACVNLCEMLHSTNRAVVTETRSCNSWLLGWSTQGLVLSTVWSQHRPHDCCPSHDLCLLGGTDSLICQGGAVCVQSWCAIGWLQTAHCTLLLLHLHTALAS
jgi:hypothetical protein